MRRFAALLIVLSLCGWCRGAVDLPPLFDPAKHMHVGEVRAGMTGYGLSVFKGTTIERFEVEVLSVLRDFNPQYDVILVRLKGANLEHTGSIAGMSGSPIYLKDAKGHERLAGAFAYGWPLMKDPIGGVQPIEYMLNIKPGKPNDNTTQPSTAPSGNGETKASAGERIHWNLSDVVMLPGMRTPPAAYPFASLKTMQPNPRLGVSDDDDSTRLRPLATPLMVSGLPPRLVEQMTPVFKAYGITPLQSGGISSGRADDAMKAKLEEGSVLAVPLLTGDVEMTAVGTCTTVVGDRVFGFGHPFNNEGPISLPVGAGEINGVIANLMTSFKLGAMGTTYGTLDADEAVGVAGKLGPPPPTIPIELDVRYTDGSGRRKYSFRSAWHPRFTPLLSATALTAAVTGMHDLPEYHTVEYEIDIDFANGQKIHLANSLVNTSMPELFFELGMPMMAAAGNPFEQVSVKRVSGTVEITPVARNATILWVNAPRLKFRPGETLRAYVNYRRFRASDAILPIDFELPRDLPEGPYQLTVSGWEQYLADEHTARPFRFSAESAGDVFDVLREMAAIRHDAVYVRLVRQADGIAIGRTAMPNLPSSRREVLIGAGRSNTTPFTSSAVKILPAGTLMAGMAQFEVTIDKNARVETGAGKPPPRHEPPAIAPPTNPQAPKSIIPSKKDEPKPDAPVGGDQEPP